MQQEHGENEEEDTILRHLGYETMELFGLDPSLYEMTECPPKGMYDSVVLCQSSAAQRVETTFHRNVPVRMTVKDPTRVVTLIQQKIMHKI